ncbi:MAG: CynX/NimT family MFS transporter [Alphaproteobacteria bacterium]
MTKTGTTRWGAVFLILFAGSVGAAQLGKLPGALPAMRADLDFGLVAAGWLISTIVLIGAVGGIGAGMVGDRFGHRRMLLTGSALVCAGSLAGATVDGLTLLIVTRFVEGVGYIAVISAAPVLIARAAVENDRPVAFGVWSFYMPFGMAAMVALSPYLIDALSGWRGLWVFNAGLALVSFLFLVGALRGKAFAPQRGGPSVRLGDLWRTIRSAGPWVVAISFGTYSLVFLSSMAFLPTFLTEKEGFSISTASVLIGIAVFMNAPGCFVGGWMLKKGVPGWLGLLVGHAGMAVCALGLYQADIFLELRYGLALALPFFGGFIPPIVLARAQVHAPSAALYGTTIGLVIQVISIGQLIGPPIMAALVALSGNWQSGAWLTVTACGLGFVSAFLLRNLDRRAGLV